MSGAARIRCQADDVLAKLCFYIGHHVDTCGGKVEPVFRLDVERITHRGIEAQTLQAGHFQRARLLHDIIEFGLEYFRGPALKGFEVAGELSEVTTEAR